MSFNLETFLVAATAVTGAILLFYKLLRREPDDEGSWAVEMSRSFFPILLIVLLFRSFLFEPFRIPSGSMLPTLEIGDFILVNKYAYGLRLPTLHNLLLDIGKPERGDVAVFRFPSDPSQNFIKRVIGVPGDLVAYHDKRLSVNGEAVEFDIFEPEKTPNGMMRTIEGMTYAHEHLFDTEHMILLRDGAYARSGEWEVPAGHYFVMGDNRDNSSDSRVWGFVPADNMVGRAGLIWLHWDWSRGAADFSRIGRRIP